MYRAKSFIFLVLSTISIGAFADQSDCNTPGFLHCAYFTGLPNNVSDGRYIKESWNGQPIVSCENYTSTLQVMPDDVPAGVSSTTLVEFSICQDPSGTNCEGVGMDYIYVENNGDKYTVDPKYYNVKLSRVASRYTSCKPGVNLRHSIRH